MVYLLERKVFEYFFLTKINTRPGTTKRRVRFQPVDKPHIPTGKWGNFFY